MSDTPRMRTLPQAARELKEQDPSTYLSYNVLQRLVKSGVIPVVCVGNRRLVNVNDLPKYLQGEAVEQKPTYGIRQVPE